MAIYTTLLDLFRAVTAGDLNTDSVNVSVSAVSGTYKDRIMSANDLVETFSYTLVSSAYRLDSIAYASATVGHTATKTFTWSSFGTADQRVATITWSVV